MCCMNWHSICFYWWAAFWCTYISQIVSIHLLMGICLASNFWLLQMKLLWTFIYKSSCGLKLSVLLSKHLGVQCLGHSVGTYLIFKGNFKQFSKEIRPFTFPPIVNKSFSCLIFLSKLGKVNLKKFLDTLTGVCVVVSWGSNLCFPKD